MSDLLKTVIDFVDRFPALAWRIGISSAVLGAAVYGAIWVGFVRQDAFGGFAADGAGIAIAIGIGCFAVGAIFAAGSLVKRLFGWFRIRRQNESKAEMLLQNVGFLSPSAKLILYLGLTESRGRFPSLGNVAPMQLLSRYKMIIPEGYFSLERGHIMQVAPELFSARDQALPPLTQDLKQSLQIDLTNFDAVRECLSEMVRSESRWV